MNVTIHISKNDIIFVFLCYDNIIINLETRNSTNGSWFGM